MKKIAVLVMACLFLAGWGSVSHGQYGDESDSEIESGIEQSESSMGRELDSEISSAESRAEGEIDQMEESMDTGGVTSR